ncbi:MAG: ParB/RepB/Spo0J family partition protein [Verrucomicrobiota bacterium]|nr:ParB/RepB/Spo0J family partition protein [Verrucomicrobiota bacterium]
MTKSASRLGRGLGSLISGGTQNTQPNPPSASVHGNLNQNGEEVVQHSTSSKNSHEIGTSLVELPVDRIVPNPYQPRKTIAPDSIRELAASIEAEGLLQPVVVRKIVDDYQLISGERRWRAHQMLGRDSILARIMTTSEISSASLSLIENLQREDLNPMDESMGYHSLINEFGLTQAKVAERVGKSRSYVTNCMRFIQLDEDLRSFLANGKISTGHAKVLLGVADENIRKSIAEKIIKHEWSVRKCEQEILRISSGGNSNFSNQNDKVSEFAILERKASTKLKRKVKIKSRSTGHGRISFSFENETDLAVLLESLGVR